MNVAHPLLSRCRSASWRSPGYLLVLGFLSSLAVAHGAIMAVDLGSEWLKVSVVKPGRSPFSIVVNEMCARMHQRDQPLLKQDYVFSW